VRNVTFIDDLFLMEWVNAGLALDLSSELGAIKVGQDSPIIVLGASNQLTVVGPTAAQFGKGLGDSKTLYVVANGGLAKPLNGTLTEGAQGIAVDRRAF
jgi:hypothetical protein